MRVSGLAVTVTSRRPFMDDWDYRQCDPETDVASWPSMLPVWDAFENHPQGVHAPARDIAQFETGGRAHADIHPPNWTSPSSGMPRKQDGGPHTACRPTLPNAIR